MGAGCSSSVLTRYKHLRAYLQSKPCLTFDVVEAFVPVSDRPPVILIGENHASNESDSMVQRCVTAFTAMKHIISDCADPVVKIYFVMETPAEHLVGMIPNHKPPFVTNGFNLGKMRERVDVHARMYPDGLGVIPFDVLHFTRLLFRDGNFMLRDPTITKAGVMNRTKDSVALAFNHMSVDRWNLPVLFAEMDSKMEDETESHRETVTRFFDQEKAEKTTLVYHYWMFQVMYWCYCLTRRIIYDIRVLADHPAPWQGQTTWELDVYAADAFMTVDLESILKAPTMEKMFIFLTLCGDYITYFVYLRERLAAKDSNGIYVLYGGSEHIKNVSALISVLKTHKQDFVRVSDSECHGDNYIYRKWCQDSKKTKSPALFDMSVS